EQDLGRALARGRAGVPPPGRQDQRHDAVRPRRDGRGAGRPSAPAPRAPGRDRRGSRRGTPPPPSPKHPAGATALPHRDASTAATGRLDLRVIAASRLLLDNVPHIKAYWIQIGTKLAQIALSFGADDLVGTVVDETITHAAGATTASGMTRAEFERMIRESGREPFERDSEYRRIIRGGNAAANEFQVSSLKSQVPQESSST